jgi:GYF domain 2/Domain of unknown function (DUF4190)
MYFVGRSGQQTGPFSVEQLKGMAASGELQATDLVWKDGMAGWEPAATLPGVFPGSPDAAQAPQENRVPLAQATVLPPVGAAGPKPNGMALTGMILGIVSLLFVCCCYGFPFNVAGIVFSLVGMNQIKADPNQGGKQMAVAGLWCSIASIVIGVILLGIALASNTFNIEEMMRDMQKK